MVHFSTDNESDLSHNQLKSLGIRSFSPLENLKYLNLNSNPWNCDDQNLCFSAVTLYDIQQKGLQTKFSTLASLVITNKVLNRDLGQLWLDIEDLICEEPEFTRGQSLFTEIGRLSRTSTCDETAFQIDSNSSNDAVWFRNRWKPIGDFDKCVHDVLI